MNTKIQRLKIKMKEKRNNFIPILCLSEFCIKEECEKKNTFCRGCTLEPQREHILKACKEYIDNEIYSNYSAIAILFDFFWEFEVANEIARYAKEKDIITIAYSGAVREDIRDMFLLVQEHSKFDVIQIHLEKSEEMLQLFRFANNMEKSIILTLLDSEIEFVKKWKGEYLSDIKKDSIAIFLEQEETEMIKTFPDTFVFFRKSSHDYKGYMDSPDTNKAVFLYSNLKI